MDAWRVLVRGAGREYLGEITTDHELEVIDRHLAVGSWKITVGAGGKDAELLREGAGIVLIRDGEIAFSGPTQLLERVHNADEGGIGTLTASGPCDMAWLSRLVWPQATAIPETGTTFAADAWRYGSANAETVLRTLVDQHAGPGAPVASRRVPGLVLGTNGNRGESVSASSRFGSLLETMLDVAARGKVGFQVRQRHDHNLELSVYKGEERPGARFSIGLGNLRSYQYTINPPEVTYVVVADQAEGTARRFFGFDRPDLLWPGLRIEEFLDGADLGSPPDAGKADTAAQARLNEGRGKASVTFEPIDTSAVVLGRDYWKGDQVTVEIDGQPYKEVVREIHYTRRPDEYQVIKPVVGQDEESPRIYERLARLQRRVHGLETRR
ncbi:siphovirus ReqiPepy6 Gp37-like family protein [Thermomonospora umbrina]|uniref:ReqiPepy6 Gp37-like protein n=1 Tax=Thermomonospora umbrina TaxID=111806 RepID=A0A3D9SMJ1_9ACTN|nr:siphovirus ReqiPepy6 Gp37-like family protein [Thermomonospora umbrina]REE95153.1 ReqiPepy6 Gp37-like protein [Thermomonospora umbrina]